MHTLLYIKRTKGKREGDEKSDETGGIGRTGTAGKRLTNGLDRIGKTVRLVIAEVIREV